ncbi:MAG: AraC family transcriptional regulator [Sphaerochaetaceae bacterium]
MNGASPEFRESACYKLNSDSDNLFLYLDYDIRSAEINMEFQHFHNYYEMFVLCDKEAGHLVEGRYYALVEGDIVLLKPGCLHKSIYFDGKPVRRLIIAFSLPQDHGLAYSVRGVLSMFNQEDPVIRLPAEDKVKLFQMLDEIATVKRNKEQYSDLFMLSRFCDFLYTLKVAIKHNLYENKELGEMPHKINTIASFIHKHYSEQISLQRLSEAFSISDCYLSRKFKELLGFSLVQYIQITRIRGAQRLLLTTNFGIQEISERCGFSSFSQFSRVFDKYCGVSPRTFRNLGKQGKAELRSLNLEKTAEDTHYGSYQEQTDLTKNATPPSTLGEKDYGIPF